MGIPGTSTQLDPHAKVRIGEKRVSQRGQEYPTAVDYFTCESPDFAAVVGDKPSTIQIRFAHDDVDEAFNTGLEWWTKSRQATRSTLACYTKDGGNDPVAYRKASMLDPDDVKRGEPMGQERQPITCRVRACPHMQRKTVKNRKGEDVKQPPDCKPMGRLVFVLDGDPLARIYQLDTKAWNSIEKVGGALRIARTLGPLTGRLFALSVAFQTKGGDRFPVLSIEEVAKDPQTAEAIKRAEATIAAEQTEGNPRTKLIAALRAKGLDPRAPEVVARVQALGGVEAALAHLTKGDES